MNVQISTALLVMRKPVVMIALGATRAHAYQGSLVMDRSAKVMLMWCRHKEYILLHIIVAFLVCKLLKPS